MSTPRVQLSSFSQVVAFIHRWAIYRNRTILRISKSFASDRREGSTRRRQVLTEYLRSTCPQGRHCEVPGWSPDGKKIAFGDIDSTGNFALNIMNADRSRVRQLTFAADDHVGDEAPRFTKDGKQILVTLWNLALTNVATYVISVDGTNLSKYTDDSLEAFNGNFNPKNSKLLLQTALLVAIAIF